MAGHMRAWQLITGTCEQPAAIGGNVWSE
jgi:hypothetical protein